MVKPRHLKNAPLVEAVIDVRVKLANNFNVARLESLHELLRGKYPVKELKWEYAGELEFKGEQVRQTFQHPELSGYVLKSADGLNVTQFRRDGFTFSRLKPYTEWETVLAEAKGLWERYLSEASPEVINRVAVRYINQLGIPLPINDFADYLTAPPTVPKGLPQALRHFMTRIVVSDEEQGIQANIIQALHRGEKPSEVNIILDIDVYQARKGGLDEGTIWTTLGKLRDLKNEVFFDSITEKTVGLFE